MKYLIAKKIEMSQRYRPTGEVVPVTIVKVDPCTVTAVKTAERDGYVAVQLGAGRKKSLTKPELGQRGGADLGILREFRLEKPDAASVGAKLDATVFAPGDTVQVTGVSKGKGYAGVVKRHHFAGGPASHGQKDQLRMPGSIGGGGRNGKGKVVKGMRMAGRMGGDQVTVRNLEIVEVDAGRNEIAIKGAVPGARNAWLLISGPGEMTFAAPAKDEKKEEAAPAAPEAQAEAATA